MFRTQLEPSEEVAHIVEQDNTRTLNLSPHYGFPKACLRDERVGEAAMTYNGILPIHRDILLVMHLGYHLKLAETYNAWFFSILNTLHLDFETVVDKTEEFCDAKMKARLEGS